jgi:hypothetical protein
MLRIDMGWLRQRPRLKTYWEEDHMKKSAGPILAALLWALSPAVAIGQPVKLGCADGTELLFGERCSTDTPDALAPRSGDVGIAGRVTGVTNCRDSAQQKNAEQVCRERSAAAAAPYKGKVTSWDVQKLTQTRIKNEKSWDGKRKCEASWRARCLFEFAPTCAPGKTCPTPAAQ